MVEEEAVIESGDEAENEPDTEQDERSSNHSPQGENEVAAVVGADTGKRSSLRRVLNLSKRASLKGIHIALYFPAFVHIFILFTIVQLSVEDVRRVFVSVGTWDFSLIDIVYLVAGSLGFAELIEISEPGVNKTVRCIVLTVTWIILGLLPFAGETILAIVGWTLSINELRWVGTYSNFGFFCLVIMFAVELPAAFQINSNTLMRSISHGEGTME
ncbi:MAG: hypothetical protein WD049_04655 [Candidatus Paceibacterota bacterium]